LCAVVKRGNGRQVECRNSGHELKCAPDCYREIIK